MRPAAALGAMLVAWSALCAATESWDLNRLMDLLAASAGGRVAFVEEKTIAILDHPVISRGEMRFTPPARLERLTREPGEESLVLDGDRLQIRRGDRHLDLELRNHPQAAAFIDSIRGTLAGDRAALERNFALSLAGNRDAWRLDLLPRDPELAELVLRIHVEGSAGRVARIEILQADGDRSDLRFRPIEPAR